MTDVLCTPSIPSNPSFWQDSSCLEANVGWILHFPPFRSGSLKSFSDTREMALVHCSAPSLRNTTSDWPPALLVLWLGLGRLRVFFDDC